MVLKSLDFKVVLLASTLPLLLFLASLDSVWTNLDNYDPVFRTNTFDYSSGMRTTEQLIQYFKGPIDAPLNIPSFNRKEAAHLADVQRAFKAGGLLFAILLTCWLSALAVDPGRFSKSLLFGGLAGVILIALIANAPFDVVFNLFHRFLFPGGTWIFDSGSLIITIYPESLFEQFAAMIAMRTAILSACFSLVGFILWKKSA